jgi:hypothetical protein
MVPTMYRGRWLLDGSASWGAWPYYGCAIIDPEAGAELRLRGATEDRCVPVRLTVSAWGAAVLVITGRRYDTLDTRAEVNHYKKF